MMMDVIGGERYNPVSPRQAQSRCCRPTFLALWSFRRWKCGKNKGAVMSRRSFPRPHALSIHIDTSTVIGLYVTLWLFEIHRGAAQLFTIAPYRRTYFTPITPTLSVLWFKQIEFYSSPPNGLFQRVKLSPQCICRRIIIRGAEENVPPSIYRPAAW